MMSEDITSIHEFDFNLIVDYFSSLERQGPGSPEATLKALGFVDNLTDDAKIADLGCGTGGQTRLLAQHCPGTITGIDLAAKFIELFNEQSAEMNMQDRVRGVVGSMDDLPFKEEEFDLIWSEGAIYNIGFERGLHQWRKFLKKGGHLAVTDASWLSEERPDEIDQFWNDAYPEIDTIANKVAQMQQARYVPVAIFVLPEYCWTDNFYSPQAEVQKLFLRNHPGNQAAKALVQNERHEAQLYRKYKDYYGYVFYIGKKLCL
jgi:ubiquinone/menaquinone biosynthesis C-methylase UbiE